MRIPFPQLSLILFTGLLSGCTGGKVLPSRASGCSFSESPQPSSVCRYLHTLSSQQRFRPLIRQILGTYQESAGGNPLRGEQIIVQYKCGSCHTIPGIRNARGVFGPPLNDWAFRNIIAGEFPNDPKTLVSWLKSPTSMKPKTAMPDLGLSEEQARDVAAYLDTLR